MNNHTEGHTIYMKDLLFAALYRWKAAIALALVFGLLLGGFALLSGKKSVTIGDSSMTPETKVKITQMEATRDLLKDQIAAHTAYLENSVLMSIDPYAHHAAGFHIAVSSDALAADSREFDSILRIYHSFITCSETIAALAEQFQMEPWMMTELLMVDTSYESSIGISFRGSTPEQAAGFAAAAKALVLEYAQTEAQTIYPHAFSFISVSTGPSVDFALFNTQNTHRQRLTSFTNDLVSVEADLNRYLPTKLTLDSSNPVLFAAVGAFIGVLLVACWAWTVHIAGDKVYSGRTLSVRTGIRILDCVAGSKKRCGVDCWLRKQEGRALHTDYAAIATNIVNRCPEAKNILFIGCFQSESLKTAAELLESSGVRCTLCSGYEQKVQIFEALPNCDAVVLAETCGQSRYDRVNWAIQTVSDYKKPLLGCVLIDG